MRLMVLMKVINKAVVNVRRYLNLPLMNCEVELHLSCAKIEYWYNIIININIDFLK